ncbi:MAG: hypothetical protein ACRENP_21325 [Longimicrobiales bacterium]
MNVHTLQIPVEEARKRLEWYRSELRKRSDSNYEAIAKVYAGIVNHSMGVIMLSDVYRECPVDEKGRPLLGLARSDRVEVELSFERYHQSGPRVVFRVSQSGKAGPTLRRTVAWTRGEMQSRGWSLVPMVPPQVRQKVKGQLSEYFTLWEVEKWHDRPANVAGQRPVSAQASRRRTVRDHGRVGSDRHRAPSTRSRAH